MQIATAGCQWEMGCIKCADAFLLDTGAAFFLSIRMILSLVAEVDGQVAGFVMCKLKID